MTSQDPLEVYFSKQRHKGGSCDNPSIQQFMYNTASLVQQGEVYRDLTTMNVKRNQKFDPAICDRPLPKRLSYRYYFSHCYINNSLLHNIFPYFTLLLFHFIPLHSTDYPCTALLPCGYFVTFLIIAGVFVCGNPYI